MVLKEEAQLLVKQTYAHLVEKARDRLHTRKALFLDHLKYFPLDDKTFVVSLDAKARWIDDGMDAHSMLDDLLKSKKAKRAKDGSTYVVVPFQQNKAPTQQTSAEQNLNK